MSNPDWVNLPSVVLYDLYHLLPLEERLAASSTCKKWRDAFFMYPNWRHLHLIATESSKEKNQFLARTGRYFCKTLHITFPSGNFANVVDILQQWSPCLRFHEFQLVGTRQFDTADPNKSIWSAFQSLYPILEDCTELSTLIFSHVGDLDRLAKLVAKHTLSLNILGLGKVATPTGEADMAVIPADLASFAVGNLKVLLLDGMWLSDGLLDWISRNLPKLKILSLIVRDENCMERVQQETWDTFDDNLPECEIRITYIGIMTTVVPEVLIKARNLTHIRLIYCTQEFHDACLNGLRREAGHLCTVRSIWSIFDLSQTQAIHRQTFLVVAWRFTHLRELYVDGCRLEDYDLVGMTRLRPSLRIHIPNACIRVTSSIENLNKEQILPIDWKLIDSSLPVAHREALILSTLASVDCKIKKRRK